MKQLAMPINLDELPAKRAYTRIPTVLLKKIKFNTAEGKRAERALRFTLSAVAAGGQIYSFTCDKVNGEQPTCTRTYEGFSRDLGISVSSVGRAVGSLIAGGMVERTGQSEYITTLNKAGTFLRLENWVNTIKIKVTNKKGEVIERRLTLAERLVFSLIFTHCDNGKKGGNKYVASYKEMRAVLGISEKTISKAINTLTAAGLVIRAEYERGVNRTHKSIYHINKRLLSRNRAATSSLIGGERQAKTPAEAKAEGSERARWYAQRKQEAEERAERNERKARTDNRFKAADTELRTLASKEAYADLRGDLEELTLLQARRRELEEQRIKALRRLRLTPDDLLPQYHCQICNDTGFTKQGRLCGCYAAAHNKGKLNK